MQVLSSFYSSLFYSGLILVFVHILRNTLPDCNKNKTF